LALEPAVAIERLSRTAQGQIRYALKTPYRGLDGSGAPSHQLPPARAPPIGSIGLFD